MVPQGKQTCWTQKKCFILDTHFLHDHMCPWRTWRWHSSVYMMTLVRWPHFIMINRNENWPNTVQWISRLPDNKNVGAIDTPCFGLCHPWILKRIKSNVCWVFQERSPQWTATLVHYDSNVWVLPGPFSGLSASRCCAVDEQKQSLIMLTGSYLNHLLLNKWPKNAHI